jgi:hypothetical protein
MGLEVFKAALKMESGLECEGDFEGTMDEMAFREERDGVGQWQLWCTSCLATLPRCAAAPAALAGKQYLHLPPSFFLLCFVRRGQGYLELFSDYESWALFDSILTCIGVEHRASRASRGSRFPFKPNASGAKSWVALTAY